MRYIFPLAALLASSAHALKVAPRALDKELLVNETPVLNVSSSGKFVLEPAIQRVYIEIGPGYVSSFQDEIGKDKNLLVIGIESNPERVQHLKPHDDRFRVFNFAVGAEDGEEFQEVSRHPSCSLLLAAHSRNSSTFDVPEWVRAECMESYYSVTVPKRRLDSFMDRVPPSAPVWWVKTDVPGHDVEMLTSAGSRLDQVRKVQYVIPTASAAPTSLYSTATRDFVASRGFRKHNCTALDKTEAVTRELSCVSCRDARADCTFPFYRPLR